LYKTFDAWFWRIANVVRAQQRVNDVAKKIEFQGIQGFPPPLSKTVESFIRDDGRWHLWASTIIFEYLDCVVVPIFKRIKTSETRFGSRYSQNTVIPAFNVVLCSLASNGEDDEVRDLLGVLPYEI
jgi:hypothetical protein